MDNLQTSNFLMLVRPTDLPCLVGISNYCLHHNDEIKDLINYEFDKLVDQLKIYKVNIKVFDSVPGASAAVFPNNWVSSHVNQKDKTKTIVLYPMERKIRRLEREGLKGEGSPLMQYIYNDPTVTKIIDLTFYESFNMFLESTGALVFDRPNKIAYCGLSDKSNREVAMEWGKIMNYEVIIFETHNPYRHNNPVYHTNIMMNIGEHFVVICLDAIISEKDRQKVLSSLKKSGRKIIPITLEQMKNFCGNCLQVRNQDNQYILCLSQKAYDHFEPSQLAILKSYCDGGFVIGQYSLIELFGGGSVRCTLLEYGW